MSTDAAESPPPRPPLDGVDGVENLRRLLNVLVDAATALLVHLEPDGPAGVAGPPVPAGWAPPPPLAMLMARIAAAWPAVTYDALADPVWIAEVENAARAAGLVFVPSRELLPRTIRGTASFGAAAAVKAEAEARAEQAAP